MQYPVNRHSFCRGFSIVEVLVAAAILSITVITIVAMVRKGGDLQVAGEYRLKARAIVNNLMETVYSQQNYAVVPAPVDNTETVTIGVRPGGSPVVGTLHTTVDADAITVGGTSVPVKKVGLSLAWDTFGGERDSIYISEWLVE